MKVRVASLFFGCIFIHSLLFAGEPAKTLRLTSADVTRIVLEHNLSVQQVKLESDIAKYKIGEAKGVFDTELTLDASHRVDKSARTSTFFGNRTDTTLWNLGVNREFATGTELGVDFTNSRQKTLGAATINGTPVVPGGPLYEPTVEFSLTQPLVKNTFGSNDRKGVQAARLAFKAADFSTQRRIQELLFQALVDFWGYVAASENVKVAEQSVASAERFLGIVERKMKLGTTEETDLLAARATLLRREAELQGAKVICEKAAERLRNDLSFTPETNFSVDRAFDALPELRESSDEMMADALATRPDYAAAKNDLEGRKVTLAMTRNERWPELDVVSTLALNEIDANYTDAVSGINHTNWMVGMNMRVPLENRGKRAGARVAEAERARAVLTLKQLEITIANEVARTTENVRQRKAMLVGLLKAEILEQEKLAQELAKYETGRSSASTIERYEDDLVAARRRAVDTRRDYATAMLELQLAQGRIGE